jgi:hypothetical protein
MEPKKLKVGKSEQQAPILRWGSVNCLVIGQPALSRSNGGRARLVPPGRVLSREVSVLKLPERDSSVP